MFVDKQEITIPAIMKRPLPAADDPYKEISPENPYYMASTGTGVTSSSSSSSNNQSEIPPESIVQAIPLGPVPNYHVNGVDVHIPEQTMANLQEERRNRIRAAKLQMTSVWVRLICLFDGIVALFGFFVSPWLMLLAVTAFFGYLGAKKFDRGLLIWYLGFYYLYTIGGGFIFVAALYKKLRASFVVYSGLVTIIRCFITWYLQRFYNMLPYNDIERETIERNLPGSV